VRVIWPYTDRSTEESFKAVMASGWPVETYDVSGNDLAYGHLLERLWADAETFLIVEHDIVIGPTTAREFAECEEEWCSSPYTYFDQPVTTSGGGLGCTKFSSQLMHRWPEMIRQANALSCAGHPNGHWCTRDLAIYTLLRQGGNFASQYPIRRHQTHTEVRHRAGKCAHGCKDEL
jgi:hypothetical protein